MFSRLCLLIPSTFLLVGDKIIVSKGILELLLITLLLSIERSCSFTLPIRILFKTFKNRISFCLTHIF